MTQIEGVHLRANRLKKREVRAVKGNAADGSVSLLRNGITTMGNGIELPIQSSKKTDITEDWREQRPSGYRRWERHYCLDPSVLRERDTHSQFTTPGNGNERGRGEDHARTQLHWREALNN